MQQLHVEADLRPYPDGTGLRSLAAAAFDLGRGAARRCHRVASHGPHARLDLELPITAPGGALVVVVDGFTCTFWGQLHPLGISSAELAVDALDATLAGRACPAPGEAQAWLESVAIESSTRAYGASMGSLFGSIGLALFLGEQTWVANAGDSVACAATGDRLFDLTRDHSLRRELESTGASADELAEMVASGVSLDGILTRSFGGNAASTPEIHSPLLGDDDMVVLAPRSLVRDVVAKARPVDRRLWLAHFLDEAVRVESRSPVCLLAQRRTSEGVR